MVSSSWFEFIVRGIPEEFLFVLAVHTFSKTEINLKKYLLSGAIFSILTFSIRLLPIQYGIHTILSLIVLIILVSFINTIGIVKAIRASLMTFILLFIFEGINLFTIQSILKVDLNIVMNDPILKTLYGLPSVILFGIFVIAYYRRLYKRKELNGN